MEDSHGLIRLADFYQISLDELCGRTKIPVYKNSKDQVYDFSLMLAHFGPLLLIAKSIVFRLAFSILLILGGQ